MESRVLIVDDDPQFARLVASIAERAGFRPRVAASASEMWDAMDPEPTLVLLDLNMPGADGLEVLRQLAARRCGSQVRVFSGFDARVLRSAFQLGRDLGLRMGEPLAKPLPLRDMQEVFAQAAREAERSASRRPDAAGGGDGPPIDGEELRAGIERDELFLVFQPILDLSTLAPVGAEALVRWRHPERGVVPPLRFVPLAEASGLAGAMTARIVEHALSFGARPDYDWEGRPLAISVNVATAALGTAGFVGQVQERLAASRLPPARLVIEVTETAMSADRAAVLEVLGRLRLRGVELSIDDFGTGTSSLERVDHYPCNELKIERAFVADVLRRPEAEAIVRSTLDLARRLGLRVVAEGIEDVATLRWLRAARCPTGQGFLFSRGLEGPEFLHWLGEWPARRAELLAAAN